MAHRRGGFSRAVRSSRRLTAWAQSDWQTGTMSAEGGLVLASLNAAALLLRPFTIIRSHYELQITSDQGAAPESQLGAFGVCVVSQQASAIGVTAIPTPVTDGGSDLFLVHQYYAGFGDTSVSDRAATRITIDSKAMRKVNEDQDMVLVSEFDSQGEGQIIEVAGRFLIKLH